MTAPKYEKLGNWNGDLDAKISVCIANYNGSEVIEACIQSVLDQKVEVPFEILLHDDASTDDSLEIVVNSFSSVRVLKGTDNVGFCISNNRMVEHSCAKYVLLLNNDAVLRPGSLSAFYSRAQKQEQSEILGLPQFSMEDGALIDRGYEFDIFMNPIPRLDEGVNDVATATGACLWIPREIWDQVGGFPEWFESVAEDIYLCQAARLLGYQISVLQDPPFDHLIGRVLGGGKTIKDRLISSTRRRALSERNKTTVMLICYPVPVLLILIPVHFLLLLLEASFLIITGTEFKKIKNIYLRLPLTIAMNWVQIRRLRTWIQNNRTISFRSYMKRFRLFPAKLAMLMRHGFPKIH